MPTLKLTYFDFKGRAEPSRLALHIGGVAFEDERLSREQFGQIKASLPFQQVPILTVDGKVVAQSEAILRYVGILSGLYPSNDAFQALLIDQVVFEISDIFQLLQPSFKEQDLEKKLGLRKSLVDVDFPKHLKALNNVIGTYGSGSFAVGKSLSIADLMVFAFGSQMKSGIMDGIPTTVFDSYSNIVKVYETVLKHPKVVEWYSTHK